jgi:tetratricopeptide (TPR) repeat protein
LAHAELVAGNAHLTERLATRCLQLYKDHHWPDDLVVVEAYSLWGASLAQRGQYGLAIERLSEATTRLDKLGPSAAAQSSRLLLNKALLYASQGDLDEALKAYREARAAYMGSEERNERTIAQFDAVEASLYTAQGHFKGLLRAYQLAGRILDYCAKAKLENSPLALTARHYQGLYYLDRRDFRQAEQAWAQVRALQEKEQVSLLLPRTVFYLGLTAELQGQLGDAEKLYKEAWEKLKKDPSEAFPATRFLTLWRRARLADRRGARAEARNLLQEAVGGVEKTRLQTFGDAQQRAAFFAQFEPGFDQLVDWCVRDGDVEGAFRASIRSRSRTLLDQLQMAGADSRAAQRR